MLLEIMRVGGIRALNWVFASTSWSTSWRWERMGEMDEISPEREREDFEGRDISRGRKYPGNILPLRKEISLQMWGTGTVRERGGKPRPQRGCGRDHVGLWLRF